MGECVDTRQKSNLVVDRVIEADIGDEEDEDNSHDLDCRELTSTGECVCTWQRLDLVADRTPTMRKMKIAATISTTRILRRHKKLDLVAGRAIEAETLVTRKTKTIATISTAGSLRRQRKPDLVACRVIEAETPVMKKICGNDELLEPRGSRARMLRAGENGENSECGR
ncbi:hypothetical protein ACLOJK_033308 [Asimina triloba]